jgi:hypothetical protein
MILKPTAWAFDATKVAFWKQYGASGLWLLPMWENTSTALHDLGDLAAPAAFAGAAPPMWVADALGVGVGFGGVSARADMVTPTGFGALMGNGAFTLGAVVRPDAVGAVRHILSDDNAGGTIYSLRLYQTAADVWQARICAGGGTAGQVTGSVPVVSGTLAVLVLTWDTSNGSHHLLQLYTNGSPDGAAADNLTRNLDNGVTLTVGREGADSAAYYSGNVLMLVAQKSAWTPAQITQFAADPFQVLVPAYGTHGPAARTQMAGPWSLVAETLRGLGSTVLPRYPIGPASVNGPGYTNSPRTMAGPWGLVAETRRSMGQGSTVLPPPDEHSHLRRERRERRR